MSARPSSPASNFIVGVQMPKSKPRVDAVVLDDAAAVLEAAAAVAAVEAETEDAAAATDVEDEDATAATAEVAVVVLDDAAHGVTVTVTMVVGQGSVLALEATAATAARIGQFRIQAPRFELTGRASDRGRAHCDR